MTVTKPQAEALTTLAIACRPTGASRWDPAGVMAAIGKVRHLSLADVALAVIRAADDRALETPAPIGNPKAHCWRERGTDRPRELDPYDLNLACGICDLRQDQCQAIPEHISGHTYLPKPVALASRVPDEHGPDLTSDLRDRVAKAQHIDAEESA
jgi:hypothetical protein